MSEPRVTLSEAIADALAAIIAERDEWKARAEWLFDAAETALQNLNPAISILTHAVDKCAAKGDRP